MTYHDIIRMAREAGLKVGENISGVMLVGSPAEIGLAHITLEEMERFAALVAAAEREGCIKAIEEYQIPVGNSRAGELACDWTYNALKQIRDEIKERGEK
jgi:hypothetical protein